MIKLIKDLKDDYPLVYEAALNNQEKQGNKRNGEIYINESSVEGNFIWSNTPEGTAFWRYITLNNFTKAKELCPHLFEDKEFVLPELWAISRDLPLEQNKIVTNYVNETYNVNYLWDKFKNLYYISSPSTSIKINHDNVIPSSHTEITFEQFKQYVLKDTSTTNVKETKQVEEWSEGTYAVFIRDAKKGAKEQFGEIVPKGTVRKIKCKPRIAQGVMCLSLGFDYIISTKVCNWFATKEEAEAYSKTITDTSTDTEFKVGDWVVGWHNNDDFKTNAWEIGKIDRGRWCYPKGKAGWNCDIIHIRKARPDEIPTESKEVIEEESKEVLEPGYWYKDTGNKWFMYIKDSKSGYGFDSEGNWFEATDADWSSTDAIGKFIKPTDTEIEERLIAEAKKRDLWYSGKSIKDAYAGDIEHKDCRNYTEIYNDSLWSKQGCVFNKGKWATVVEDTKDIPEEPSTDSEEYTIDNYEDKLKAKGFKTVEELSDYINSELPYSIWKEIPGIIKESKAKHLWDKWYGEKDIRGYPLTVDKAYVKTQVKTVDANPYDEILSKITRKKPRKKLDLSTKIYVKQDLK